MAFLVPFDGFDYHPHQIEAISWLITREAEDSQYVRGGILADEMGLGKTWMTIGLLLNAVVPNTLLLVPPALQPQWSEALVQSSISHRILAPGKGTEKPGSCWRDIVPAGARKGLSVAIATYDRAAHNSSFLMEVPFDRIVCDEGHVFKNGPSTKRFRELQQIPAARRWILSGTPIQNTKYDLNNLLRFIGMSDEDRIKISLETVAKEVLLRRIVSEVREAVPTMPTVKPTHIVHPVTMPEGGEESSVFASLVGRFEHAIESHARTAIVLELYLRIRQFLAHPAIYVDAMKRKYGEGYKRETWTGTASKMDEFRRFLGTSEKRPTIVFGTFKGELDLAEITLAGSGYNVWSIRGGMTDSQRERVTEESRNSVNEGKPSAIVVQIVAGGAGLNLQHFNRIVFLSSHWNPAIVDQAIARAYRMGQTHHVEVHHMLLADNAERNLDRYMAKKHGTKRDIALKIHDKLFCDSAVNVKDILETLDEELGDVVGPGIDV